MNRDYLLPDWPAPANVHGLVTTRLTGDEHLEQDVGVVNSLHYLKQVHGSEVINLAEGSIPEATRPEADALYCRESNKACCILTADCLPVFFCDQSGDEIALAHAGWRGLVGGVLENTLAQFKAKPQNIIAWFGPAIGPCHFEVGSEVKDAFIRASVASLRQEIATAFTPSKNSEKWMADLFNLAKIRLKATGLKQIYGGGLCTFCEEERFYSYRRNNKTGRLVSVIWKS